MTRLAKEEMRSEIEAVRSQVSREWENKVRFRAEEEGASSSRLSANARKPTVSERASDQNEWRQSPPMHGPSPAHSSGLTRLSV